MAQYDARIETTKGLIQGARDAVAAIGDDERAAAPQEIERLNDVLNYAELVVGRTTPTLVADGPWDSLDSQLTNIPSQTETNAAAFVGSARQVASDLAAQLVHFPVAQKRASEQAAAGVISGIQRAADEKLKELREELKEVTEQEAKLREQIGLRGTELEQLVTERKQELEQSITDVQTSLATERQRVEEIVTEQADLFRKSQDERAEEFSRTQEETQGKIEGLETNAKERTEQLIAEIEELRGQSAELVGAIGVTGTAERYQSEAADQKTTADRWRQLAVVVAAGAVAVAIWAAASANEGKPLALVGKLAIGAALGALAAYAAKQSSRHRDREEDAKAIQLDLAAFNVFVEPLPAEKQDDERVALGRRLFGQRFAARSRATPVSGSGPTLADQAAEAVRTVIQQSGSNPSIK